MPVSGPSDVQLALEDAHRAAWAMVVATALRITRDLDLAEDCAQEAYTAALKSWPRDGVPANAAAWLTTITKRRAVDAVRRAATLRSKLPLLVEAQTAAVDGGMAESAWSGKAARAIPDERLRLIFLCCHPALAPEAQMALTLRLVCGLSTADIARAFLVSDTTMGARLTRAKRKIATARIPFAMPDAAELSDRLAVVLGVIYLLFTAGHAAPSGDTLTRDALLDRSLHLARLMAELMPHEPESHALLALLLVTGARRATRVDASGAALRLEEQDRAKWDRAAIREARTLVDDASRAGPLGRFGLQAEIALCHAEAPTYAETDWARIVLLYDRLLSLWPSPVVALNRAVAVFVSAGPQPALAEVDALEADGRLADYHYLFAIKAELLDRLGRADEAASALRRAVQLVRNDAERQFLSKRLQSLHRN